LAEGLGIEAGCDGDPASIAQEQLEGLSEEGSGGGDGIGEDGDGEEVGSGVAGRRVRGGRLRGGWLVEAFSEGMEGDPASLAELGLGQAATAELVEEGVPAEVEDVAPRHGVNSRTGTRPHHGNDLGFSPRLPDAVYRTDTK
jgi:hypothetical protein